MGKDCWGLGKEWGGLGKDCILWQKANLRGQRKMHHGPGGEAGLGGGGARFGWWGSGKGEKMYLNKKQRF